MTAEDYLQRVQFPMAQHEEEFLPCVRWLLERFGRLGRVLEIGTQHGGTAAFWCEITDWQIISIDMPFGVHGGLSLREMEQRNQKLRQHYPHFYSITGNSQEQSTLEKAKIALNGEQLDLLFIDGDHRYEKAKQDFEMYGPLVKPGGVVLFHDIQQTPFYDSLDVTVYKLWRELQGEKYEFNIHHEQWGGLGAWIV